MSRSVAANCRGRCECQLLGHVAYPTSRTIAQPSSVSTSRSSGSRRPPRSWSSRVRARSGRARAAVSAARPGGVAGVHAIVRARAARAARSSREPGLDDHAGRSAARLAGVPGSAGQRGADHSRPGHRRSPRPRPGRPPRSRRRAGRGCRRRAAAAGCPPSLPTGPARAWAARPRSASPASPRPAGPGRPPRAAARYGRAGSSWGSSLSGQQGVLQAGKYHLGADELLNRLAPSLPPGLVSWHHKNW